MKTFSLILLSMLLVGCSTNQPVERIVTRTEIVTVNVPIVVKPERPNITCDFTGIGAEVITKLLKCVILHKRALELVTEESKKEE